MNRYSKYFINHILWLGDGFSNYYLQNSAWGGQEIPDVEFAVFNWPEDVEQWLTQCMSYDAAMTLRKLRDFLSEHCMENFNVHEMNDFQVVHEAARQISRNGYPVVIEPKMGWAVQVDGKTSEPVQPFSVEPAPELDALLADLKVDLDALVSEQQKKYEAYEAQMEGMSALEKYRYVEKMINEEVYDTAIGDTVDMVKAAPGVIWGIVKAFPGFYVGYLKTVWKVAQVPGNMATLAAEAIMTGNMNPLKEEIDKIVDPVAHTYEQAAELKSMLTILLNEPATYNLLYDFATRYWKATHPIELAKMGASTITEVLVAILLALVTAGAGIGISVAAKSGKLVKIYKKIKNITNTIKKLAPDIKLPSRSKNPPGKTPQKRKLSTTPNKGVPKVDKPEPSGKLSNIKDGPKTTPKKQTGARELEYWDFDGAEKSYDTIRASKGDVSNISKNTGMKEFQVERIKDHLFNKKHQLDDGVRRFDADPQIANAWKRLEDGNYTDKDVQLLKHELFESKFEGIFKVDYRTAHGAANRAGRLSGLE